MAGFESGPLATHRLMKLAHPHMVARGGGMIFNFVSSAMIRWDMATYGAYGAVKAATQALTRAAAAEWGREGIRVLNIAPHAESPGLKWWIENNADEAEAFFKTIPLGRIGTAGGRYRPRRGCAVRAGDGLSDRRDHPARRRAGLFLHEGLDGKNRCRIVGCGQCKAACRSSCGFAGCRCQQGPHQYPRCGGGPRRGLIQQVAGPAARGRGAILAAQRQCAFPRRS